MMAAMVTLLAALAVPAIAEVHHDNNNDFNPFFSFNGNFDNTDNGGVSQEIGNEPESGNVDLSFSLQEQWR